MFLKRFLDVQPPSRHLRIFDTRTAIVSGRAGRTDRRQTRLPQDAHARTARRRAAQTEDRHRSTCTRNPPTDGNSRFVGHTSSERHDSSDGFSSFVALRRGQSANVYLPRNDILGGKNFRFLKKPKLKPPLVFDNYLLCFHSLLRYPPADVFAVISPTFSQDVCTYLYTCSIMLTHSVGLRPSCFVKRFRFSMYAVNNNDIFFFFV